MTMASLPVTWVFLSLAVRITNAIPAITFPINSQVPPVARIGQPFSFVFSESTFTSSLPITYRLANPPAWLSIDSNARRLYGTPRDSDVPEGEVVGVPVTLIASDDTGSATLEATLVVSRDSSPSLEVPINEQIPPFGTFSGPSSILAPPDAPFSFQVFSDTFSNPSNHPLNYYAVTHDHTPLPAWVTFDPTTLLFSGRTPPFESLIQPPQAFSLQLVASDVEGFSAASLEFTIVVGADTHEITATQTVVVLNVTAGEPILYTKLREDVKVDGQPATPENSVIKSSNLPSWLTLDTTSWQLTGTPPDTADSTSFTISLEDKFSNTLNITFVLEMSGQTHTLLNGSLPIIDIIPGEEFSFDLAPFLTNPEDVEMSVSGDLPSWIQIDPDSKTIAGLAPLTLKTTDPAVELTVDLKSKSSSTTDSTKLIFSVADAMPSASSAVISQPSASSTSSMKAPANGDQGNDSAPPSPVNTRLLAILLPILLLAIALIILFIWWIQRRRREQQEQPRLMTREISEPLPGSFVVTAHGLPGSESHGELENQSNGSARSVNNDTFAAGAVATAVEDHEKKDPIESREIYQTTEGELMVRPVSTVRLIPSTERLRTAASNLLAKGRAASLGSRSAMSSRRGRPTRGNSTLSSISETTSHLLDGALGMGVVGRGGSYLDLPKHHNNSASSFRGDVEINIPALRDPPAPPESTYTGDESNWTDAPYASSPPGSSRGISPRHSLVSDLSCEAPDVMAMPLRTVSRQGHCPAAPTQKFSWPWNRKTTGGSGRTSRVSFFSRTGRINSNSAAIRHTSQQASLRSIPSIDTSAQREETTNRRGNNIPPAKNGTSHDRGDSNTTTGISFSGISFPRTPTLPELPRLPSLIRSPTKTGQEPIEDEDEEDDDRGSVRSSIIPGTIKTTTTTATGKDITTGRKRAATFDTGRDSVYTANDSAPGGDHLTNSQKKKSFIPDHSVWNPNNLKGHSHDSLGIIYSDLVKKAPYHPSSSGFWSSPASTPARKGKEKEPAADNSSGILPPNWALRDRDSSPAPAHAIKGWGASSNIEAGDDDVDGEDVFGGGAASKKLQPQLMGSPMKSPRIGISEAKIGSGGLRLVEPSSSIRGPPSDAGADPEIMSINTVDYWKARAGTGTGIGAGAPSTAGPGSSVMSIPRDMTPDRTRDNTYWNKLGGKMFTRGDREGTSWTADLGAHSSRVKKKSSTSRGKSRRGAGSVSRFSMISEVNGKEDVREKDKDNGKEKDAAAAVSLASASKSSVGGSHYYI